MTDRRIRRGKIATTGPKSGHKLVKKKGSGRERSTLNEIKRAIDRYVWLRSKERAAALKRTGYTCQDCGVKQSSAKAHPVKLDVHHANGCDREAIARFILEHLLHDPQTLHPLCKSCHDARHQKQRTS